MHGWVFFLLAFYGESDLNREFFGGSRCGNALAISPPSFSLIDALTTDININKQTQTETHIHTQTETDTCRERESDRDKWIDR